MRALTQTELQRIPGIHRRQHRRVTHNLHHPQHRERDKPHHHHRPKQRAHTGRATALYHKQPHQHRQRQRQHIRMQRRRRHLQAFYRGQHRDRRCDHPVAVKQRRANDRQKGDDPRPPRIFFRCAQRQRHQRHLAAFAAVIRTQQQQHIFQRHHQHQRPEHHRQHTQHVVVIHRHRVAAGEHFLHGVERAGADVAVDHADCRERQGHQTAALDVAFCG